MSERLKIVYLASLFVLGCGVPQAIGAVVEDVIELPVAVKTIYNQEVAHRIVVTVWRDDSRERAPFLVLNHGRPATAAAFAAMPRQRYAANAQYFVARGFVVFIPTRVGYGPTGGDDVEYSGPCQGKIYPPVFRAAAEQTLTVLAHAKTLPFVDASRGIVVGQSFGGATAIALASLKPEGVLAAVNFAGGSGGNPEGSPERPCRADLLERTFSDYGKASRMPTLWLYSENDRYWGKDLPKRWFDGFLKSGGNGQFVQLPAHGKDGHPSFTANAAAWKAAFEEFVKEVGL
jgi:dienelactone hydrolase